MNQREKLLVGAVIGVVLLFVGRSVYKSYSTSLTKLQTDLTKAKKDLNEVDIKLAVAKKGEKNLAAWKEQSLPSGSQTRAYQLYEKWLYNLMEKQGLKPDKTVRLVSPVISPTIGMVAVEEHVNKCSLTSLVEFLHEFYSSPQLHQISRLELTPEPGGANLKIRLQVEALILPDTADNKVPAPGKLNPFKLADVGEYRVAIDRRNIFKPYKAPIRDDERVVTQPPATIADLNFARFTGTQLGNKGLVAWIYRMNTGDTLFVSDGEAVNIGAWKGKVVTVEPRAVVLEKDGKRTRVDIGSLIKDGKAVQTPPPTPMPESAEKPVVDQNADAAEPEAANI